MYMRPFTTSRMITVRLPPPVLPGRISGSTSPHSSSVRSLGYRNLLRSQRARFWLDHIGDPSSNQATILESQMIHMIQELFGQTLSGSCKRFLVLPNDETVPGDVTRALTRLSISLIRFELQGDKVH